MPTYAIHPYALLFPPMTEAEYIELKESIRQNGLREPIVLWGDLDNQTVPMEQCPVLDGRNRLRACEETGTPLRTVRRFMTDAEALEFVIDLNFRRRQLTDAQRAAIAAEIATLKKGGQETNPPIGGFSQADAAEMMNVSLRSTQRAAAVKGENNTLYELVKEGKVTPSLASLVAKLTDEQQEAFLDKVGAGAKPTEVFNALKREIASALAVSELLDTPQVERDSPQATPQAEEQISPLTTIHFDDTPMVLPPLPPKMRTFPEASPSEETAAGLPTHEFPLRDGYLSAEHHHYLTGVTFHEGVLSVPPVEIDGMLWVCLRSQRSTLGRFDVSDCVWVMPMDDYVEAQMDDDGVMSNPPMWFDEWQRAVDTKQREANDLLGLKLTCTTPNAIGYYVCLAEKRAFVCTLAKSDAAPVADEDAADPHFTETDTEAEASGLRSVYLSEEEQRAELVASTAITDETPLLVFDYVRELDLRFRNFLLEPDIPVDFFSRFVPLDDYDFPTYWETLLLNMARRIFSLEAVQNGQAVPVSAKSLYLLKMLTDRWKERIDNTITVEEYLSILIEQKAEQVGINTDEVTA